jgi:hypothetical protein
MADPIWISHIFLRSHLIGTARCEIAVYIVCNKAGAVGSLGAGRQSVIGQIGDDEGDAVDVNVAAYLAHNCGDGQKLHSSAKLIALVIDLVEDHSKRDSLAGTNRAKDCAHAHDPAKALNANVARIKLDAVGATRGCEINRLGASALAVIDTAINIDKRIGEGYDISFRVIIADAIVDLNKTLTRTYMFNGKLKTRSFCSDFTKRGDRPNYIV